MSGDQEEGAGVEPTLEAVPRPSLELPSLEELQLQALAELDGVVDALELAYPLTPEGPAETADSAVEGGSSLWYREGGEPSRVYGLLVGTVRTLAILAILTAGAVGGTLYANHQHGGSPTPTTMEEEEEEEEEAPPPEGGDTTTSEEEPPPFPEGVEEVFEEAVDRAFAIVANILPGIIGLMMLWVLLRAMLNF
jgi:hypothetical protein